MAAPIYFKDKEVRIAACISRESVSFRTRVHILLRPPPLPR